LEAELLERAEDVGTELDAGTDLAEFGRLLEHPHREALARKGVRRGQAADAAARHQDRQSPTVSVRRHRPNPPAPPGAPFLFRFATASTARGARKKKGRPAAALWHFAPAPLRGKDVVDRRSRDRFRSADRRTGIAACNKPRDRRLPARRRRR